MEVRKRTWKGPDGKRRSAFFMDYVDPVDGLRRRETITGIKNKEDADKIAAARYREICLAARLGEAAEPTDYERSMRLDEFLADDLERVPLAATTRRLEKSRHKALKELLGATATVVSINFNGLVNYQRRRQKQDVASSTVNDELAILRSAMNRAKKAGTLSRIPDFPESLPEQEPRRRFLTPDQVDKLIETVRMQPITGEVTGDAIEVMYCLGGLRPCELWAMKWGDVDFTHKAVTIPCTKRGSSKKIRVRVLPMSDNVCQILKKRKKQTKCRSNTDLVFGTRAGDRKATCSSAEKHGHIGGVEFLGDFNFNDKIKAAAKKAGFDNPGTVTAYCLRHSAATNAAGADIVDVAYMLGHADPRMTLQVYRHMRPDRLKAGMQSLSRHKEGTKDSAEVVDVLELQG